MLIQVNTRACLPTVACLQSSSRLQLRQPWLQSRNPPKRSDRVHSHERGNPRYRASLHCPPCPTPEIRQQLNHFKVRLHSRSTCLRMEVQRLTYDGGKTLKPHLTWHLNLLFNGLNGLLHLTNVSYAWNMLRNTSFILTLLLSFAFCCTRNRFASCPRIRVRGKSRNCMFALATIVMTFAQFKGHLGSSGRCDIPFTPIVC